jgi:hypothetical protein
LPKSTDWQKSWEHFLPPTLYAVNFAAETIEAFVETFPQTRQLLSEQEKSVDVEWSEFRRGNKWRLMEVMQLLKWP